MAPISSEDDDRVGLQIVHDVVEALRAARADRLEVRVEVLDQEGADRQEAGQLEQLLREIARRVRRPRACAIVTRAPLALPGGTHGDEAELLVPRRVAAVEEVESLVRALGERRVRRQPRIELAR